MSARSAWVAFTHPPTRRPRGVLIAPMRRPGTELRRRLGAVTLVVATLVACQPVEVLPIQTGQARTDEIETLVADGFQIAHPPGAVIDTLVPADDARTAFRVRGPHVALGLPTGAGSWHGPAYELEILRYANPAALTAEAWVADRVFHSTSQLVEDTMHTRVSGRSAVRVVTFAGNARMVTVYVPRDRQMVALRYFEFPIESHPAAPAALAVHRMMVSTFRYLEQ